MYTFAADDGKLTTLASDLRGKSDETSGHINTTYGSIGGFETDWQGESYDTFVEGCEAYRGALETIPEVLNNFAEAFEKAASGVPGLQSQVEAAMSSIS